MEFLEYSITVHYQKHKNILNVIQVCKKLWRREKPQRNDVAKTTNMNKKISSTEIFSLP